MFQKTQSILCLSSVVLVVFMTFGETILFSSSEHEQRTFQLEENTSLLSSGDHCGPMRQEKLMGVDGNYLILMQQLSFRWRFNGVPIENVYSFFHQRGVNAFRLRVFAMEEGDFSFPYALHLIIVVDRAFTEYVCHRRYLCDRHSNILHCIIHLVTGNYLGYKPAVQGFLGRDEPAGKCHLHYSSEAEQPGGQYTEYSWAAVAHWRVAENSIRCRVNYIALVYCP